MTFKKPKPLHLKDDPACVTEAIKTAENFGYSVSRPSPFQIKVGPVNFYPTTGKITTDPHNRHPTKGLDAFLALIEQLVTHARHRPPPLSLTTLQSSDEC